MNKCKYLIIDHYSEELPKYTCELLSNTENSKTFINIKGVYEKSFPGCNYPHNEECLFARQDDGCKICPYYE